MRTQDSANDGQSAIRGTNNMNEDMANQPIVKISLSGIREIILDLVFPYDKQADSEAFLNSLLPIIGKFLNSLINIRYQDELNRQKQDTKIASISGTNTTA